MRYIGFDIGDGESAVAAFEKNSHIEPLILPVCGAKSLLSAVGMRNGEIVIGERAYTDALADNLSVRFKSRFLYDPASAEDASRFLRGMIRDLQENGRFSYDDSFVVGCPAGWNTACRARYREVLMRAGLVLPQVISESRAAFLYAKYSHTIALDIDVLNESALVADIGSSTLDYAYIVDGHETGMGTFGENSLGGGVLDAALLRRCVEKSRHCDEIKAVFAQSRSWYSYCEIEARRVKEEFFTRLENETSPVVKKQLHICYDGVQKLTLEMDLDTMESIIREPLPELDGRSFVGALRESLENARRLTADRLPALLLLTGGASRMPFFREMCQETFETAIVVSCPEPEFSIAKGLAYAGWVDENLRAFRHAIQDEITENRLQMMASEALPALIPAVADLLTDLILEEAALPAARQWKRGNIATLQQMQDQIADRTERVLSSALAQQALAPAVETWLNGLSERLQSIIDPICDEYEVPRKEMKLDATACGGGHISVDAGSWTGLPVVGTLLGIIVSVAGGVLCGGSGLALVASGPLGIIAGLAIGALASVLGWNAMSKQIMNADIPVLLRNIPLEKRLQSDQTRHELKKQLTAILSGDESAFCKQITEGFAHSFHSHVQSIAQAAEIPIV